MEAQFTGTMTRKGNGLNQLYPELLAEISPEDAQEHNISDGDEILPVHVFPANIGEHSG